MTRVRAGAPPEDLAETLAQAKRLRVEADSELDEYLAFVLGHPAFPDSFERFCEDLEHAMPEWSRALIWSALADPDSAPLPARRFAEEWTVSPAQALLLAHESRYSEFEVTRFDEVSGEFVAVDIPGEANGVSVYETAAEFVIRIPRPVTSGRRAVVEEWLKTGVSDGVAEEVWGSSGKARFIPSPSLVEAIPWFTRWNAGEEPAKIWGELVEARSTLSADAFRKQLERVWERMREIHPGGVRDDRPSSGSYLT
jgi:hypothetical protein